MDIGRLALRLEPYALSPFTFSNFNLECFWKILYNHPVIFRKKRHGQNQIYRFEEGSGIRK